MRITLSKLAALIFLLFFFSVHHPAIAGEDPDFAWDNPGTITGRILHEDGTPFPTGFVAFFDSKTGDPQDIGSTRRSPVMIAFIQEDGRFTTSLTPPGHYYLGAMLRQKWRSGPPSPGEKRFSAFDEKGQYIIYTLKGGQQIDIGSVIVKEPEAFREIESFFTVSGRVLDDTGQGVTGSVVLVKKDLDEPKALFISDKTAADGSYSINIPPGIYFFVARETLTKSGRPRPDSNMGVLGQNKPISVGGKSEEPAAYIIGRAGELYKNIDITMFKVPKPEVLRQETEAKVKANKFDKADIPSSRPHKRGVGQEVVESPQKPEDNKKE